MNRPKKHLGQNFLVNTSIKDKIITACDLKPDEIVLEIGPGQGALTRDLADRVKHVIAVETDKELFQKLSQEFDKTNVTVIHADILKYSFQKLPRNLKVIGNLPYYICTPIIEKVLQHREIIQSFFATVQLEVGQRLTANKDNKRYGAFTCFVQYFSNVKMLFKIRSSAFFPIPKVNSCLLQFDMTHPPALKVCDEKLLFGIIRQAFQQRRKTIVNALSARFDKDVLIETLNSLQLNPRHRAENLSLENYVALANALHK